MQSVFISTYIYISWHIKKRLFFWKKQAGGEVGTYINFSINDVYKTTKNNDEVKHIPGISKIILEKKFKWNFKQNLLF